MADIIRELDIYCTELIMNESTPFNFGGMTFEDQQDTFVIVRELNNEYDRRNYWKALIVVKSGDEQYVSNFAAHFDFEKDHVVYDCGRAYQYTSKKGIVDDITTDWQVYKALGPLSDLFKDAIYSE